MEKNLEDFQDASLEKLVEHALLALRDTLPAEENLTEEVSYIVVTRIPHAQLIKPSLHHSRIRV